MPPNLKCDLARFDTFLGWLPRDLRIAFEFRNDSWFDPEVYARLRDRNLALCLADSAAAPAARGHGRVRGRRLRDEGYDEPGLVTWADRARTLGPWDETYVYFKHEDEGRGPEFAAGSSNCSRRAGDVRAPHHRDAAAWRAIQSTAVVSAQ